MRPVRMLVGLALVLLTGCASGAQTPNVDSTAVLHGSPVGDSVVLPDAVLRDTTDQAYRLATTPSSPVVVVVFGYTNCDDRCSGSPGVLSAALADLPSSLRSRVTGLFITVDPKRDDPDAIAAWLTDNAPGLTGLTGDHEVIEQVAARLGVPISGKQHREDGYVVGHGTHIIAFDRTRSAVVAWDRDSDPADVTEDLEVLVTR